MRILRLPCRGLLALLVSVILGTSSPPSLRGSSPDDWTVWSARPELAPETKYDDGVWSVSSDGSPSCHGGWDINWNDIAAGEWHRAEVVCKSAGIASIQDNAHAELIFWKKNGKRADWRHVRFEKRPDGDWLFSLDAQAPADAASATLRLMLRWTDRGKTVWREPALSRVAAPKARLVKVAITTGKFPGGTVEANLAFALGLIEKAAAAGAKVICLPEVITTLRTKDLEHDGARTIPGRESDALCAAARKLGVDIVCSMSELNGKLIHNTGLYIDSQKGIVGKYRKVHLAVGERWRGVTPGKEFPVWDTEYGKAGMLICYDNVHAEAHRVLSQKGAEILFLPIMGDPRAVGEKAFYKWKQIMSVRAMDNHVWFVVCQNKGEWGCVVRPDGEIVAEVNPGNGFAMTEIDLNFRHDSWIGSDFKNRNWGERRPAVYGDLTEDR
jgi:predicted amidohydrolase